jgi:peptide/nickel transport system substrate-binding protein
MPIHATRRSKEALTVFRRPPVRMSSLAAGLAVVALVASACGPASQPATPTSAPAATTAPAAPAATTAAGAPAATTAPAAAKPTEAAKPAATTAGGILRSSELGGAPKILHPYPESQQYTTPWSDGATLMWANLIDIDWEKVEFVADPRRSMAKEMPTISNDGRTFTFTLRDDLKFSDGQPVTAADFQYAWDQASKKENNWVSLTTVVDRIEAFRTPDPKTVEVTLKEKLASYLAYSLASGIVAIPKHVWEGKSWLDASANPEVLKPTVVTGPYVPKEINAERHVYTRNPNWWGEKANIDEIQFISATPTTTLELLKTRQVEWAHNFPPAQWEDAQKIAHANAWPISGINSGYRLLQFNLDRPHIKELKFRQALAHAINREDLVQFEDGLAEPQFGMFPTTNPYATENVQKYEFDLNRSKQLLTEAGYRLQGNTLMGPDGQPVKIGILWPTTSQPRGKMATYAQQQWRQLGIETEVTGLEFNAFVDQYQRLRDFDIAMGSFGGGSGDPDSSKPQVTTGGTQNSMNYSNPEVDKLFEQGAQEQNDALRKTIYDNVQRIVVDEMPQFYLVTYKSPTAMDKKVQNVKPARGDDLLRRNNLQVINWAITAN